MRQKDWFLRVMLTLLVIGVWALILKPLLAPAPTHAASADQVVRARKFELVDREGRVRGVLGDLGFGSVGMSLRDGEGILRVGLSVVPDGRAVVSFFHKDGKPRAALGVGPNGSPAMLLTRGDGKRQIELAYAADGGARLRMVATKGQAGAALGMFPDGSPYLVLQGTKKDRAILEVFGESDPGLFLYDKEGKQFFKAP